VLLLEFQLLVTRWELQLHQLEYFGLGLLARELGFQLVVVQIIQLVIRLVVQQELLLGEHQLALVEYQWALILGVSLRQLRVHQVEQQLVRKMGLLKLELLVHR